MKTLLFLLACSSALAVNPDRMLYALAAVETRNNPKAIGKAGERSQWQLTEAVWREYTREPFYQATNRPILAGMVAKAHVQRLAKHAQTPYAVARKWNPNGGHDYASRVANIYHN